MRFTRGAPLVLAVGLLACSAPSKHVVVTPTPTDDPGRARALLLTESDLPDGWRASVHSVDPIVERENRRLASCASAPDPAVVQTADVYGKDFGQGAQIIGSESVFVRTAADAAKAIAALKNNRAVRCATASVRPILAEQLRKQGLKATVQSVHVTRLTLPVRGFVAAFRVVTNLSAAGATLTIFQDAVFLAKGRAQVRATFIDVGVAFPMNLELALSKKLAAKLDGGRR